MKLSIITLIFSIFCFGLTSFSQDTQVEDKIIELLTLFDQGKKDEVVLELEQCLSKKDLPDWMYPFVICKVHEYYYSVNSERFDCNKVNNFLDKYISSKKCFQNEEIFNIDYYTFIIAQGLNKNIKKYNDQLRYLEVLESGYRALGLSTNTTEYFSIIYPLIESAYFNSKPEVGLKYETIALELVNSVVQSDSDIQLYTLFHIARNYILQGNKDTALFYINNSINLAESIFNTNNEDLLYFWELIEESYSQLRLKEERLSIYKKITTIAAEVYDSNHPDYLIRLNNLAMCYSEIGKTDKAIDIMLTVAQKNKSLIGEDSNDYILSLYNLARFYSNNGDYKIALELDYKLVQKRQELLGEDHPDYLLSLSCLAIDYSNLGQYLKSLEITEEIVRKGKKYLGKNHPDYLGFKNNLAALYAKQGLHSISLKINIEIAKQRKKVLGEEHPDYLTSLDNLSQNYLNLDNHKEALALSKEVVSKRKYQLGEDHPDYIQSLIGLASVYSACGNYEKSLEINHELVQKTKTSVGEHHPEYLLVLNNLALTYLKQGEFEKSLEINQIVVQKGKEVLGGDHIEFLSYQSNLALAYYELGEYNKSLEINKEVLQKRLKNLGEYNPSYIESLNNLASVYSALGSYNQSLQLRKEHVQKCKEVYGTEHSLYYHALGNLSHVYSELGFTAKSLDINKNVLHYKKKILGDEHPEFQSTLNNLACNYADLGNYTECIKICKLIVNKRRDILGVNHPDYIISLSNLATYYSNLGDYEKALGINIYVARRSKTVWSESHPHYLMSLNNLASSYSDIGDYKKSLEINSEVARKYLELLGDKHPSYLVSLSNLANNYLDLGDLTKALELNEELVKKRKELLGEYHPEFLLSLHNLAAAYSESGDYSRSLEINKEVTEKYKAILGQEHPNYLTSIKNTAYNEAKLNLDVKASAHYFEACQKIMSRVIKNFAVMTENQRELFLKKHTLDLQRSPFFLGIPSATETNYNGFIYDISLFIKGLLLNTKQDFEELLKKNGTAEAIVKFNEIKTLKLQEQKLEEQPIKERNVNLYSLQEIIEDKEMELIKLSAEYGEYTNNLKISWKNVQHKLKKNEVAIEFVEYPTLSDSVKYAALVLRKNWSAPKMISLFQKDQLEKWLKSTPDIIYSNSTTGKKIKELIWKPLEEYIDKDEKVYFSASGLLYKIAIENLPVNDSMTIGDCYSLYRLSSTKELVTQKRNEVNKTAVLYGGLNYNINDSIMLVESETYSSTEKLYASRAYIQDSILRSGFDYLPATLQEVEEISQLMQSYYQVTDYTRNKGNEESFKSLSGQNIGILHIATHGFFLPKKDIRKRRFNRELSSFRSNVSLKIDPMQRSGLILAGGNKAWKGNSIQEGLEDGVLTAKEISMLDFSNTNMVVLSACETGLGDVSNEGVFGLQRSFKQAGVQTLVMTLWKIEDQATSYFMTQFYHGLLGGMNKRTAFLEAKKSCRKKLHEPKYWAAFIMLD